MYFRTFAGLIEPPDDKPERRTGDLAPFRFEARNCRPPTDPINAMLSLAYAMLTRQVTIALASVGLDPYRGFYHASRYGRPALALDIMEPFRAIIADFVVLSAINTGELGPNDFVVAVTGTALTQRVGAAASSRRSSVACPRKRRIPSSATKSACAACSSRKPGSCRDFFSGNCRAIRIICRVEVAQMHDERLFIVTYDISDQRRWRRVFKVMHGYGDWI